MSNPARPERMVKLPSESGELHIQILKIVMEAELTPDGVAQLMETLNEYSRAKRWNDEEVLAQLRALVAENATTRNT